MKMCALVWVLTMMLAATAPALNTVSPLDSQGGQQTQQGLIGEVGPSEDPVGKQTSPVQTPSPSGEVLEPVLGGYPDLWVAQPADSLLPLPPEGWAGGDAAASSAPGFIGGLSGGTDSGTDRHWSTDPRKYCDAGFMNAAGAELPALAEMGVADAALPTEEEASIMEIVVFPALAVLLLLFAAAAMLVRLRRRKALSQTEQLLQV